MNTTIALIALFISITSLAISVYFAIQSMRSSAKANELSESQKTAALISIVAPACESSEQWRLFIDYLSKNNRLPYFSADDEFFLSSVLNRLEIKASIVNGRLTVEN
jgi:hypothetical protein